MAHHGAGLAPQYIAAARELAHHWPSPLVAPTQQYWRTRWKRCRQPDAIHFRRRHRYTLLGLIEEWSTQAPEYLVRRTYQEITHSAGSSQITLLVTERLTTSSQLVAAGYATQDCSQMLGSCLHMWPQMGDHAWLILRDSMLKER